MNHELKTMNHKGQVAVILILVIAAALIFYAISLNLGRLSQAKIGTTIAADTGTSKMASSMASYGHSLFMTSLGGERNVCGLTGAASALVGLVVAIIAVVLAVLSAPAGGSLGIAFYVAVTAAVLSTGAFVMQTTMVQPGMSSGWNTMSSKLLNSRDQFVEQGIQTAMSTAVGDMVQVPDMNDSDLDRLWGFDGNGPRDLVSRFGFYYGENRINTIALPIAANVGDFYNALRNFTRDDGDGWGIYDDTLPNCIPFGANSECNPCCVPQTARYPELECDGNLATVYPGEDENTIRTNCEAGSPYGDGVNSDYFWAYDAYRGDPVNGFDSFQELLGRDDEHRDYQKNPVSPNGVQAVSIIPGFRLEDTTGFYPWPIPENRKGTYGFFYKIADWVVDLQTLTTNVVLNPQCNWCDVRNGTVCDPAATQYGNDNFTQLQLPIDPVDPSLVYNKTYCVDGANVTPGFPPLEVDYVRLSDPLLFPFVGNPDIGKIEADDNQCAQNSRGALPPGSMGFWKRGGDRFCSAYPAPPVGTPPYEWPYCTECPKYDYGAACDVDGSGCECGVGAPPPSDWPDDLVDDINYGLNEFIIWAQEVLSNTPQGLAKEFANFYNDASVWIEPGTNSGATSANNTCSPPPNPSCCYVCNQEDGSLHVWYKEIQEIRKRLQAWRDSSYAATTCVAGVSEVWCVPAVGCPGGGAGAEAATFDQNGNVVRGDFEDVVACLNWNVNNAVTTTSATPVTATGNYEKFRECNNACVDVQNNINLSTRAVDAVDLCSVLPRSLVPDFDTIPFINPTPLLLMCNNNCNTCITNCAGDADCIAACTCGGCNCSDAGCLGNQTGNAKGSCNDTAAGGFMDLLSQSIPEAQNQGAKFRLRYNFLNGRLTELNNIITIFTNAETKFLEFLTCVDADNDGDPDGPACKLIKDRFSFNNQKPGLPYQAIYGWQTENDKWHLVRVDARIPERCDTACGENQQKGSDPLWPWIETYTVSWGMKRCYALDSTTGVVKTRVARYDQTGDSSTLLFSNGVEIWKPVFTRPDRPQNINFDPDTIGVVCKPHMLPNADGTPPNPGTHYYGAFILNEHLTGADDNTPCWNLVNGLLARGVASEACAQYYFKTQDDNDKSGMDFRFVPCGKF